MEFPFYWNEQKTYTINDADYWCQRIIIWDCNWGHRYASLCELIEDCPGIKQLTRPCIVDALNDLQTLGQQSGLSPEKRFLRIWTDGCLEVANPCICNDWDKYVIATEDDNDPGPLSTKVRWSCSDDGLYCIDIEVGWPKTLVWRPSGPNNIFISADEPNLSCDTNEWFVKVKKSWGKRNVSYECDEWKKYPDYLYAYHDKWENSTSCKWKTIRYFATKTWESWYVPGGDPDEWDYATVTWSWSIRWTTAFAAPSSWWVFKIVEPGIYSIAFSLLIQLSANVLNSIRVWLYQAIWNISSPIAFTELWDIKYDRWEEAWQRLNRMHPQDRDPAAFFKNWSAWRSLDFSALPFARTYVLNVLTTPVEIALVIKPDMRFPDARINTNYDAPSLYGFALWMTWQYSANCSIEVVKIAEAVPWEKLLQI